MPVADPKPPYFLPTTILALLPAVYAWQVHGWLSAIIVFCATGAAVVGLGYLFLLRSWPLRWLTFARAALIITIMVLVGLSAAEICDIGTGACTRP